MRMYQRSSGEKRPFHRGWIALLIFVGAFVLRLGYLWQVKDQPTYCHPQIDELAAHEAAVACVRGQTPPHAYLKAPLYTYSLAGVYRVFGVEPRNARIVQAILSSLIPILMFLITDRLAGRSAGVIAGILGAAYWMFVFYAIELVDASLASLAYLLLLYVLVCVDERHGWKWLLAGVMMGLGAIIRPNVLLFAPVLALTVFVMTIRRARLAERRECPSSDSIGDSGGSVLPPAGVRGGAWRGALINVAMLTVSCCATIAPVTLRNRVVGGEWVPIAAYGGINFWVANNPESDGKNVIYLVGQGIPPVKSVDPNDVWSDADLNNRIAWYHAEKALGRPLRRGEVDAYSFRMGLDYVRQCPGKFLGDVLRRFVYFFNAYEFPNVRSPYEQTRGSWLLKVLSFCSFGVLVPLLMVGSVAVVWRGDRSGGFAYLLLMLGAMLLGGVFFVMNSRFRFPLVCLSVPLVAVGLLELGAVLRGRILGVERITCVVVLLLGTVLANVDFLGYRPSYHTDILYGEANACREAQRTDLLDKAAPRLEKALRADQASGRRTWSTLLLGYYRPFTALMRYYKGQQRRAEAIYYGSLMLEYEVPGDLAIREFFNEAVEAARQAGSPTILYESLAKVTPVLDVRNPKLLQEFRVSTQMISRKAFAATMQNAMEQKRTDDIYKALGTLDPILRKYDRPLLAEYYLQVGDGAKNRDLLLKAEGLLEGLAKDRPSELKYQEQLAMTRRKLAELTRQNPTTSRPGKGAPTDRGSSP